MSRPQSPPSERPDRVADVVKKREALEELLRSDGWQYFEAYVRREWQNLGYQVRMGTALSSGVVEAPKAVHLTALEMVRLLDWPANQVRELKGSTGDE